MAARPIGAEPLVRVPDDSDPYVWLSSNAQGTGPWVGGLREGEWIHTARHSIEEGRALDSHVSSLWARKGETGRAVRLIVCDSVICPESVRIKSYHLTGHDLIAFKIQIHEVFAQIGVKSQKHFFPLASGPIHIRELCIGRLGTFRPIPAEACIFMSRRVTIPNI